MNGTKNIKLLTIILTSFLLGVVVSLYIGKINVKNFVNYNENTTEQKEFSDLFLDKNLDLTLFWRTYNIIKNNYYNVDGLENEKIVYGINKGLVESLDDKFSEFMDPEETKKFEEVLSGDFEGIGAVIEKHELGVQIDRVIKGSPAKKYGLLKGDVIIKAGDVDLAGMDVYDAVAEIKGPAGTTVSLTIFRLGERDYLVKDIIRDKIKIPSVDSEILDGNIVHISLNMFGENTSLEFSKALEEIKDKNVNGLIIDLRDNGGGYLQSAVQILSNFIEEGKTLVTTKYRDSLMDVNYPSENRGEIFNKKIVVLINSNSASASEITAGALKDYNKAILVGEKTYGKGSVQQPFDLGDGSLLKLTIAKWFTPNGNNIDLEGIEADIEVKFEKSDYTPEEGKEDEFKFYDRQLEKAKEVLNKYIELDSIGLTIDEFNNEK